MFCPDSFLTDQEDADTQMDATSEDQLQPWEACEQQQAGDHTAKGWVGQIPDGSERRGPH